MSISKALQERIDLEKKKLGDDSLQMKGIKAKHKGKKFGNLSNQDKDEVLEQLIMDTLGITK